MEKNLKLNTIKTQIITKLNPQLNLNSILYKIIVYEKDSEQRLSSNSITKYVL